MTINYVILFNAVNFMDEELFCKNFPHKFQHMHSTNFILQSFDSCLYSIIHGVTIYDIRQKEYNTNKNVV